ncbi:probable calcium-binding protein CML31 [Dendrobium catenatum]|uniref:Putative calcium-binding protein CML31 n=1 Tax=Dendrobium catenatum TaxID=906689 RepID=A0A2I0V707_9ASPA|nr:probable calcium-binding protein CML31 [Dendrobium catenatum]PKU59197.1 putative calcium-binding protein CML31 [Dendrobium catenatum]
MSKLNIGSGGRRSSKSLFTSISGIFSLNKHKKPCFPSSSKRVLLVTSPGCELESVFRYFDEDGDGKISAAELCSCLHSVGEELSPAEAEAIMQLSDSDGDGVLGYDDFVKLVDMEEEEERESTIKEAFSAYEMDGSGCITARSLRRGLRRLGEEKSVDECSVMIKRFDLNGDGVICLDEFKLMML